MQDQNQTSDITLANFRTEVETLKKLKEIKDDAETVAEMKKADYDAQRMKVMSFMQENELDSFKVPGVANVVIANKFFVAYPSTVEDIEKFHAWLDENGRGHERKLHSQTLNTLVNEMIAEAKEQEEVFTPPPGLGQPSSKQELRVLKG